MITRASHYTFMHVSTVNYLLNAGFFCELLYNCESFPANNKKIMQPQNFSTVNYLHYTIFAHDRSHEETSDKRRNKTVTLLLHLDNCFIYYEMCNKAFYAQYLSNTIKHERNKIDSN